MNCAGKHIANFLRGTNDSTGGTYINLRARKVALLGERLCCLTYKLPYVYRFCFYVHHCALRKSSFNFRKMNLWFFLVFLIVPHGTVRVQVIDKSSEMIPLPSEKSVVKVLHRHSLVAVLVRMRNMLELITAEMAALTTSDESWNRVSSAKTVDVYTSSLVASFGDSRFLKFSSTRRQALLDCSELVAKQHGTF